MASWREFVNMPSPEPREVRLCVCVCLLLFFSYSIFPPFLIQSERKTVLRRQKRAREALWWRCMRRRKERRWGAAAGMIRGAAAGADGGTGWPRDAGAKGGGDVWGNSRGSSCVSLCICVVRCGDSGDGRGGEEGRRRRLR